MNRLCCSKWYILWIHTIKHSFHSIPHVILLHWKKHKGQFITQPMLYETLKRQYIPPRKMSSRSSRIYRLWMDIQHIIGPANLWPLSIRRLFWTRPLRHWQRILICTFAYVNGLNPEVLIEWVLLLRLLNNESVRHIQRKAHPKVLYSSRKRNKLHSVLLECFHQKVWVAGWQTPGISSTWGEVQTIK